MTIDPQQLTRLQSHGIHWQHEDLGLVRRGGAGPTDHKALDFHGQTAMIPVFNRPASGAHFSAKLDSSSQQVEVFEGGQLIAKTSVPMQPQFYNLCTAEGIPYSQIATLHSKDVLATTVLQECVRYRNRSTSCQFCAIEESLKLGKTIAHKRPEQLAEVAAAAVALDGVSQMIMTTGTPKTLDRGAAVLVESIKAVKARVNIPIQAQCEPPSEDIWLERLKDAGADALGMHLEAVSERVRNAIMPGKASVPLNRYMSAFAKAVSLFGAGNVSTYILAGLGDTEDEIITMSLNLIDMGVYPFVVPFVPVAGTPLADHPRPDPAMLDRIFCVLGPALANSNMQSEALKAGCAKCGACSSLKSYETALPNRQLEVVNA
ncbi:radical SAM protein, MSMEG_0568 family [Spongiibacter sp. IMCC21906]|uniref:MSMEG_0568 family radical SAM protein n=1 Tax=Spongiibacter sp. IMCC21906 TaxID=1620392 RepID=UPI00062DE5AE|nr:MSMEG_0568 family radical SAM protein [Spongiibacter sp. IMCC21906]AKH68939.1 radical SAM protein, MSMEG_0568 family [Spongiibacter sp. IMCC21906]